MFKKPVTPLPDSFMDAFDKNMSTTIPSYEPEKIEEVEDVVVTDVEEIQESLEESVEFNEAYLDLMEANLPINMLVGPGGVGGGQSLKSAAKSLMKDAWRALTGKQKSVIAKVHKLTQSDDELGKLYRDGWKGGGTSMKPGARKAFDARVKELLPNEETRDYVAAWKDVKAKVQSAMKDQQNEALDKQNAKDTKKKFDDLDDSDIDNDGDTDDSDKYLHNRRKAIAKAIASKNGKSEAKEHSYTVVHAKKGKVVVTAPDAYAAAQKAAKQWKLKSTAGVDSYIMEAREVDPADVDIDATKQDKASAKMNIIMQLRKSVDVDGNYAITFADGKKQKIPVKIMKIALAKVDSFRKPVNKEKLQIAMGKSYKDMINAVKTMREEYELMEAPFEINYDDSPNWGEEAAIKYGRSEGYREFGVVGAGPSFSMVLFQLNSFDKKYTKDIKLKSGETIFRYTSRGTVVGKMMPLVKININRGLLYFLTDESSNGEIDEPVFKTKSMKLKFVRLLTAKHAKIMGYKDEVEPYNESVEQVDEKMDRETKRDVKTLIRLGDKPRLAIKTAKDNMSQGRSRLYTPKKQKDAYRKAYESVEQVDENQDIKATAPKEKPTKVGQQATTPSDIGRKYPDNKWVVKKNTATSKAYRPLEWVLESVEQVDEGLMNDIRDFIVAVGAAIPTKKNKNNARWKSLENEIRMAMEADPEFDKLVRNAAYVRKDGITAFKAGTHSKLDAYVRKTVDSKAAEKLGTLQKGYIKTLKSGEKRNIGRSSDFTKKQQADIDSGKTVYDDDMEATLRHTTNAISKVIKSVTQRAHYDAKKEQKNESVEHLDEIVAKQNKNGEIEMTKAKYAKVHKDFKGKWPDGVHYVTQHQGRQGMTQVPVKFVKEEVEVDVTELWEADYKLQHNTFLGAIREAYTIAEQNGFTVDEDDWTNKIMHGPMKPSNGEINNYSIGLLENNKVVGNQLLIRVSNIGKTYELTAHVQ